MLSISNTPLVQNFWTEYNSTTEDSARGRAQEMMAEYLTTRRRHTELTMQSESLEVQLQDLIKERQELTARTEEVEKCILEKGRALREVEAWRQQHECEVEITTRGATHTLLKENNEISAQCILFDKDAVVAQEEYKELFARLREAQAAHDSSVASLKELFISQGVAIQRLGRSEYTELDSLREAVAEQRHEIAEMDAILLASSAAVTPTFPLGRPLDGDLPVPITLQAKTVESFLITVDVTLPAGSLQRINGARGNGLQVLRVKHSIDTEVILQHPQNILRLRGESSNVAKCEEEIRGVLSVARK